MKRAWLAFWLGAARIFATETASTNGVPEFRLLSQVPPAQASRVPAPAATSRGVLRIPTVHVTYSGISPSWASRMARVLAEARANAQRHFGFNMPDVIKLTVTVAPAGEYKLFNDMRDQVTYHLRSEADLEGFDHQHWYFLYGMSHEVAHLAMYRTFSPRLENGWLNWDGQEAWAHYLAGRLTDMSYAQSVCEFWPGKRLEAKQSLEAERESAQPLFPLGERQLAEHWRALADLVGDRGLQPLFERWNKVRLGPEDPAHAVSRAFNGYQKAEQLQHWWHQAAPLMLTQPGKSPFPPTDGENPAPGAQL